MGNLVQILTLRRLQDAGHMPFALVGGATGIVGDPRASRRSASLNAAEVVAGWVDRIRGQIEPFLSLRRDNAGPHRRQPRMDRADCRRSTSSATSGSTSRSAACSPRRSSPRASEAGISYTEFSYQILQAIDFLELYRRHGVTLQTGGSDQWGNLTAGVDLIRRVEGAGSTRSRRR